MKSIKYRILLIIFNAAILISCNKDWLDEKPDKNLTVPETLKDFEAMLDNTDLNIRSALTLGEVASDNHYVLESRWAQGFDGYLENAYTWTNDKPNLVVPDWNSSYNRVIVSNVILEGIEKIGTNSGNMEQKNRIKGGALFNRARHFYELSQSFCAPYDPASAALDLGIPLRLAADITIKTIRSTVKQTYDAILKDLLEAKDLLPVNPLYKTRASKLAVYAQLARVYLSMRDYTNAGKNADSCLRLYNRLLNYNTLSTTASFIGQLNDEVIFHSTASSYNIVTSSAKVEKGFVDSYGNNDLRKKLFFRTEAAGTIVFKGNYSNSSASLFFGLATDELYLVRAECYAREGRTGDAMADLNFLLKARWSNAVTYPVRSASNANDALKQVLDEREKELFFRGQRWTDLRRLNFEPQLAETLTRTIGGKTHTIEPVSYRYTFPIPDDVIQLTGIPQNKGWNR